MADQAKFLASKRRLYRFLRRTIAEAEQMIRDMQWWNENRNDAEPFDIGGTIVYLQLARQCLALVESNQRLPDDLWARLTEQARANAEVS